MRVHLTTKFTRSIWLLALGLMLAACVRTPVTPLPTTEYPAKAAGEKRLLVLLRGLGGSAEDFAKFGFIEEAQKHYPHMTIWVPDTHMGYYRQRSLLPRLREDIVQKAQQQGFTRIDFAGLSLGGFGSLLFLQCCDSQIASVILISPYLGDGDLQKSLASSASLAEWRPDQGLKDYEAALWLWLQQRPDVLQKRIWLGYGAEDRLGGHALLARELPVQQTLVVPGGHKNPVFAQIWQRLLQQGALE